MLVIQYRNCLITKKGKIGEQELQYLPPKHFLFELDSLIGKVWIMSPIAFQRLDFVASFDPCVISNRNHLRFSVPSSIS